MKISDIKPNPQNPRTIKDDNFKKLVQSIKDFPEMLDARPLVLNKDNVILGGNMRFKASKEAGLKEVPVKIVDWSEEKQREFVIKDNVSGGDWDWDLLANEWDAEELDAWGLDLPKEWGQEYGEEFSLDDSDKSDYGQMTFMLAEQQQDVIKEAIAKAKTIGGETYGNDNSNGNALYWIVEQWLSK